MPIIAIETFVRQPDRMADCTIQQPVEIVEESTRLTYITEAVDHHNRQGWQYFGQTPHIKR
jgi:hypothetical protein